MSRSAFSGRTLRLPAPRSTSIARYAGAFGMRTASMGSEGLELLGLQVPEQHGVARVARSSLRRSRRARRRARGRAPIARRARPGERPPSPPEARVILGQPSAEQFLDLFLERERHRLDHVDDNVPNRMGDRRDPERTRAGAARRTSRQGCTRGFTFHPPRRRIPRTAPSAGEPSAVRTRRRERGGRWNRCARRGSRPA